MFDTLRYSKFLESVGVSRDQAEAHIKIMAEIVEGHLATKQDFRDLRHDLEKLEYRLVIKMGAMMGAMLTLAIALTTTLIKLL